MKKKETPGHSIHDHSLFFDKLIELIPARFYLPVDDKDKPWFQGLSKTAKASAKNESRENIKKARRDRLDPEKASTTLDLLKQSLENGKEKYKDKSEGENEREGGTEHNPHSNAENRSVTYEELRQRLHRRIEELRGNRKGGDLDKAKNEKKKEIQRGKRKRNNTEAQEKKFNVSESSEKIKKDAAEASDGLTFTHVKIGKENEHGRKKRKLSKLQELEKAKRLEEAKKDPEKGEVISQKHSWKAATIRAAGVKVHDDPKLLKQSIKKEKKKHQKNVEKWKERIENKEKIRAEKQQTRSGNIAEKIHQKKLRRIAKREKKLMRPGFEGRKEGFINDS
ncbi:PREDICTED: surfeit locus protein 6 [Nelumbo nucifera]|uniref:Surfeit locus protein 6 n=1 Tax=Nelumbo nucifera TaxID=4432 RepID=A0A1U8B5U9_NELNU|nr:PREDICTED: surfeit locus protein 6 [Nelumbo nucifera]